MEAHTNVERPVLVTGAAGFIGSHLSRTLLQQQHVRVIGLDNFDPFYPRAIKQANLADLPADRFELIEADITDLLRVKQVVEQHRPGMIYHIAALAGVRPSIADPARYVCVNLDGLTHLLEAARAVDCRAFVFASSSSVYGNNRKVPFAETDPVDEPISPNAATKRAGELLCHTYAHLFDLRIAALRFFTVYGPGQRPDLAIQKFMRLIAAGRPVPMFGDGTTSRDYTYIDDIIQGVRSAGRWAANEDESSPAFRLFNLGGSSPISLANMIAQIGEVIGRTPQIERKPMQPGDVDRTYADLTRSRAELGYEPQTPFAEGLEHQWAWLEPRLKLYESLR